MIEVSFSCGIGISAFFQRSYLQAQSLDASSRMPFHRFIQFCRALGRLFTTFGGLKLRELVFHLRCTQDSKFATIRIGQNRVCAFLASLSSIRVTFSLAVLPRSPYLTILLISSQIRIIRREPRLRPPAHMSSNQQLKLCFELGYHDQIEGVPCRAPAQLLLDGLKLFVDKIKTLVSMFFSPCGICDGLSPD